MLHRTRPPAQSQAARQLLTRSAFLRLAAAVPLLLAVPALAAPSEQAATRFIEQTGNELAADLGAPGALNARRPQFVALMDRAVAMDEVGRFCLGRYWRSASPTQQQQYLQLFRTALTNAVLLRLNDYQGSGVALKVVRAEPTADGVHVATQISKPGSAPYNITWVVDGPESQPRIVDVVAEGVSLRQTQRSDYASFLGQHGGNVDALIQALRAQAARGG